MLSNDIPFINVTANKERCGEPERPREIIFYE